MRPKPLDGTRFVVTAYDGKDHSERVLLLSEVLALEAERYDHYLDLARGRLEYRDSAGAWVRRNLWATHLGEKPLTLMYALQLSAGSWVTPWDFVELTGDEYLREPNNVSKHLSRLREAHGERPASTWLFVTRRSGGFAALWPVERSWIRIERLDPQLGAAAGPEDRRPAA